MGVEGARRSRSFGASRGLRPRAARWGIVLLALAVAVPATTVLGKGGEGGPIGEKDTSCWPCHVGWATPLKTFYTFIPPAEAGAAVGQEFDYVVQLQNPWLQEITFVEPRLDLSNAPSLRFAGGPEPIAGLELPGSIPLQAAAAPDPANPFGLVGGSTTVPVTIPLGVTYVDITLTPADKTPNGPTLTLNLYTGGAAPPAAPTNTSTAPGPGQPATLVFPTVAEVAQNGGSGNWTLEAAVAGADRLGLPTQGNRIPFVITVNARAETTDVTSLIQPQNLDPPIAKLSSFLFTYRLKAVAEPAAGEVVGLGLNGTMYYEHDDSSTDDFANVTKDYDKELTVTMAPDGSGRVVVLGPDDAGFVVVQPKNGASIDTFSEVVGYVAGFLLVASIWTGGMFGKASRRQLNSIFGSAKRRVAFHNFLSYGIILFAAVHTVLFIIETAYYWTLGVLWGGLALLAMAGLGVTGAWQVGMIRRWNYATWRWSHYGLAVASILFSLVHMALDGVHFAFVQESIDWSD
ncbi:MAG TPA: ferric reductase-like transmembrane domain-containing protein, partial [Candidatus Thermoplasmatota archaeon]|nr:ferric reductase-like transmembrane domain-containing protein [Candidatus Thermoplasmatota archaeon]